MQAGDVLIGIGQFAQNFSDIRGAEESAGEFVGDKVTTGLAISGRIAETDADAAESNMLGPPTAAPARPRELAAADAARYTPASIPPAVRRPRWWTQMPTSTPPSPNDRPRAALTAGSWSAMVSRQTGPAEQSDNVGGDNTAVMHAGGDANRTPELRD